MYCKWTEEMNDIIRKYYVKEGGGYCAKELGVTINAVHIQAQKIGIKNPRYLKWCEEEDMYLKYHYHKDGSVYCSKFLNRTTNAIVNRAIILKLEPMRSSKTWLDWEDEIIRRYYPFEGTRGCYERLGKTRTIKAIKTRANNMGIRRR